MPVTEKPRLPELQKWMRKVLTSPTGVRSALEKPHPSKIRCLPVIGETPEVSREARLSIYGNGYFSRIIDVLGINYSSVKNVVGDKAFYPMARAYLIKHPSMFRSIDDVGDKLSSFLKTHPVRKKFPFLSDLAALEWAAHQSFFADDLSLLDPSSLANLPEKRWRRAKLDLDPSVRLLKLSWPVDDIWRADGNIGREKITRETIFILVFRRPDKFVRVPRISAAQFALLKALQEGLTLENALARLARRRFSNDHPLQTWFSGWIQDGIIKKIRF